MRCPDVPAGTTNTGTRWTKKRRRKSGLPALAVEVQTHIITSSTGPGAVVNVNIHSSYRDSMTTYPGGRNYLGDNLKMNIKTGIGSITIRILSILTIVPVLALMAVAMTPPESTKAA
jgi:hypothetical protein